MGKGVSKDKATARPPGTRIGTSQRKSGPAAGAELYRSIFESLPDGVILAVEGKITLVNSRFEEMIGYSADELAGASPTNFVVTDERERAATRMQELLQGGSELPSEYSLLRKDGARVAVDVRSASVQHEGKPAVLSIVRDVSNPGPVAETLKEAEEWWRSVVENTPDFVCVVDGNGDIQFTNRTAAGVPMEEIIGSSTYDWVLPEYRGLHKRCIDTVFETGEPAEEETEGVGADGASSWYLTRLAPIMKDGKIESAVMIATDITERKEAEEALRESQEWWRAIVENAPSYVSVVDRNGVIRSVNATMLGIANEEPIGTNIDDWTAPEDREMQRVQLERVFERGESLSYEARIAGAEGTYSWLEVRLGPIMREGTVVLAVAIATDITKRKRLEEELQTAREDLEGKVERRMESGGNPYKLTFREFTVLHHVIDGVTDKEIATRLGRSAETVRKHVARLRHKMKAASRTEVAARALREGLVE